MSVTRILRSYSNGSYEECGIELDLERLEMIVGGSIEMHRITAGTVLVTLEDAQLHGLPCNEGATELVRFAGQMLPNDHIAGDCVLVGVTPGGDFVDAPSDMLMAFMALHPSPGLHLVPLT